MGFSLGMKIDEQGNAVPGPTSIPPAAALAAGYNRFEEEDEPLDSVDLGVAHRDRELLRKASSL